MSESGLSAQFDAVFGPIRDVYLVHFLRTLKEAQVDGQAVLGEPAQVNEDGVIRKEGVLNLPLRDDFVIDPRLSNTGDVVPSPPLLQFDPVEIMVEGGMCCQIQPFSWDKLWLRIEPKGDSALLMRTRLWYLDWFQSRVVRHPEGVMGVLHGLEGPHSYEGAQWIRLDMGTAPVEALTSLALLWADGPIEWVSFGAHPAFEPQNR